MSKNRSLNAAKRAQAGQKKKLKLSEKLSLSQKTLSATQKSTLQKKISQVTSRLKQKIKNSVFDPELFQQAGQLIKNCNQGDAANLLSQEFLRYYAVLALKDRQGELAIKQLMQLQQKQPSHPPLAITLAGLNGTLGNEEISKRYARKYATLKPVTPVKQKGKLNLLVLKTVASGKFRLVTKTGKYAIREGHNNLDALLDKNITKTIVRVDQPDAAIQAIRELPYKPDVVFNNITDAERCEKALQSAQRICDAFDFPVFNSPKAVLAASREGNYERFKDNPDILLPRSIKIPKTQQSAYSLIQEAILTQGFELPVIIRLAGYQGGKYMQKVDDLKTHDFTEMDAELKKYPQTVYLIQYHDVSCEDERLPDTRLYPKYRAFMVGGKLYPCHIFTASDFNVHKKNADPVMAANPWLIDKERHFCENPVEHLGKTQWLALEAAMRETGLGYNGVDFAVATSPEHKGKLVVFEINPAMRNWVNQLPEGDHVQQAWKRITVAAHDYFADVGEVEPWDYQLPKGKALAGNPNAIHDTGNPAASLEYYQQQAQEGKLTEAEAMQWLTLAASWPDTQDALDSIVEQALALHGQHPTLRGALGAFELIYAWRTRQYDRAERLIEEHREFLTQPRHPLTARMTIFFNFVMQLCHVKQAHEALYRAHDQALPLIVVGESHGLAPANAVFSLDQSLYQVDNRFIIGAKMHHLANPDSSHHAVLMKAHLKRLEGDAPLLFCLGEIDCRPDEGLWNAIQNKGLDTEATIDQTLSGYLNFLANNIPNARKRTITIQGIPAPGYRFESYRPKGNEDEFLAMLATVNDRLKAKTLDYGWHFLDVYSATADEAGRGNGKWHIDGNHLSPMLYAEADKWLITIQAKSTTKPRHPSKLKQPDLSQGFSYSNSGDTALKIGE